MIRFWYYLWTFFNDLYTAIWQRVRMPAKRRQFAARIRRMNEGEGLKPKNDD